jgi:predicted RNA-binding protein with EMAP domain
MTAEKIERSEISKRSGETEIKSLADAEKAIEKLENQSKEGEYSTVFRYDVLEILRELEESVREREQKYQTIQGLSETTAYSANLLLARIYELRKILEGEGK